MIVAALRGLLYRGEMKLKQSPLCMYVRKKLLLSSLLRAGDPAQLAREEVRPERRVLERLARERREGHGAPLALLGEPLLDSGALVRLPVRRGDGVHHRLVRDRADDQLGDLVGALAQRSLHKAPGVG